MATVVARLALEGVPSGSPAVTYEFLSFSTDTNWSPDQAQETLEELTAAGLDGARYRLTGARWPIFSATTIESFSSYAQAVARARAYSSSVGRIGTLTPPRGIGNFRVTVLEATATPASGIIAGSTGAAYLTTQWSLRRVPTA